MITTYGYWMQRDSRYRGEWTEQIQKNGAETIKRINNLLGYVMATGIECSEVTSGWRTKKENDATPNSAKMSRHLTAEACDLHDPERKLAQWCLDNKDILTLCELWMESPSWCAKWNEKTQKYDYWCHFQTTPPASDKRVFIPANRPPVVPLLRGESGLPVRVKL